MNFTSLPIEDLWNLSTLNKCSEVGLKCLKTEMLLHRKFQYQMHLEHQLKCSSTKLFWNQCNYKLFYTTCPVYSTHFAAVHRMTLLTFIFTIEGCVSAGSFVELFSALSANSDAAGRRLVQCWLPHAENGLRLNWKCSDFQKCSWFKSFWK